MDRTPASAIEILTWINQRLADHPACAGFILDGMLNRLSSTDVRDSNWELGTMRGGSSDHPHTIAWIALPW